MKNIPSSLPLEKILHGKAIEIDRGSGGSFQYKTNLVIFFYLYVTLVANLIKLYPSGSGEIPNRR
jgi:hypothetical protein